MTDVKITTELLLYFLQIILCSEIHEVQYGQFPYIVGLFSKDFEIKCGGVIITRFYVLTVASCFQDSSDLDFEIITDALTTDISSGSTRIHPVLLVVHPEYEYETLHHDIAIIKTGSVFYFPDCTINAPLARIFFYFPNLKFHCVLVGWMFISENKYSLHYAQIKVQHTPGCYFDNNLFVDERFIVCLTCLNESQCFGIKGSIIICDGFVELLLSKIVNRKNEVVPCNENGTAIYTNIAPYVLWLKSFLQPEKTHFISNGGDSSILNAFVFCLFLNCCIA